MKRKTKLLLCLFIAFSAFLAADVLFVPFLFSGFSGIVCCSLTAAFIGFLSGVIFAKVSSVSQPFMAKTWWQVGLYCYLYRRNGQSRKDFIEKLPEDIFKYFDSVVSKACKWREFSFMDDFKKCKRYRPFAKSICQQFDEERDQREKLRYRLKNEFYN